MNWTELDWPSLDKHRERFLEGKPSDGPYWESEVDLASYNLTFGERIGWKWDAVLDELKMRGWKPPGGIVMDWGCGSGIAGRRVIERFGAGTFSTLQLWDHSSVAAEFARDLASKAFPEFEVAVAAPGFLEAGSPIGLLLLSHVLNELPQEALDQISSLIARSNAVVWVEPGSRDTSRKLGKIRDQLVEDFRVVAPCTHANACPILKEGRERDWCHHFGFAPGGIFADANWAKFGQRAGIDLRSLPYSFIALDRNGPGSPAGLSRVIGRPETFKPYVRILNCDAEGAADLEVMRRNAPGLYKELSKTKLPLVYRWEREGDRVVGGEAFRPGKPGGDGSAPDPATEVGP
ncbi:MAG TPA: small ribosomal subunit Rsm22 family protein [Opitutaceae bacterium]|jgi:SAM-dependent methyltransferase|nr:small ribosomal subunit Rsm22 family protein [Opitutaceae bacterium]